MRIIGAARGLSDGLAGVPAPAMAWMAVPASTGSGCGSTRLRRRSILCSAGVGPSEDDRMPEELGRPPPPPAASRIRTEHPQSRPSEFRPGEQRCWRRSGM